MPLENINRNPASVDKIKNILKDKINILDIGAAGGIMEEFKVLNNISNFYGFEPRKEEAEILNRKSKNNQTYFPYALSDKNQSKTFYNCASSSASSFYPDDKFFNSRFAENKNNLIKNQTEIECVTLDSIMDKFDNKKIDVIKLDTEGCELEILRGATKAIDNSIMIISECHFSKFQKNNNQHFAVLDEYIQNFNFFLFDIDQKRFTKSYLPVGKIFSFFKFSFAGDFKKEYGQIKMADVIYFKDPIFDYKINKEKAKNFWNNDRVLKLITLLDLYNYQDSAIEILFFFKERFKKNDVQKLLNSLIKFNTEYFTLDDGKYKKNYLRNKFFKGFIARLLRSTQNDLDYDKYLLNSKKIFKKIGGLNEDVE